MWCQMGDVGHGAGRGGVVAAAGGGGGGGGGGGNGGPGGFCEHRRSDQGLVAAERNGRWGTAIGVPGLTALNEGGFAEVKEVSCTSAGNCAAGGTYTDQNQHPQGFVVDER